VANEEKLLTYLNSVLKVLLGLDIYPRVPKKKLTFFVQCNSKLNFLFTCKIGYLTFLTDPANWILKHSETKYFVIVSYRIYILINYSSVNMYTDVII